MLNKLIYVDHSATTYLKKEVLDEMLPYFTQKYGNPSSTYMLAQQSKEAINVAREQIARAINAKSEEIYFTAGGSESDNLILRGIAYANKKKGNHIITSKIEHPAVLNTCRELEKQGFEVTYLDVDTNGLVNVESLKQAINENTILISIMFANNEIGTILPIEEIGEIQPIKEIAIKSTP